MGKKKAPLKLVKKPKAICQLGDKYHALLDDIEMKMERFMDIVPPLPNQDIEAIKKELELALKELDRAQVERDTYLNDNRDWRNFNQRLMICEIITIIGLAAVLYQLYK